METQTQIPEGVRIKTLETHEDFRGCPTEPIHSTWDDAIGLKQWNRVRSRPKVMRGMHAHLRYDEHDVLLRRKAWSGMRDTRRGSPTEGKVAGLEVTSSPPQFVVMPTGIFHRIDAFDHYSLLVGMGETWDPARETD
jgi:dTDP-4-dehydrorhamnose 3,5-epimerase